MNLNYKRRKGTCECGSSFVKNAPNHERCDVCRRAELNIPVVSYRLRLDLERRPQLLFSHYD